jgi:hypothetical protein
MTQPGKRNIAFTYLLATVVSFSLLTGCAGANNIEVVGSYFPYWLICMVVGVLGAFASRVLFVRLKIEPYLGPLTLIYVCVMVGVACLAWLFS